MTKEKTTGVPAAIFLALLVGAWLLTTLIYFSVFSSSFKSGLASTFGHHWLGKVILSYVAFAAVLLIARTSLKNKNVRNVKTWTLISAISIILIVILISGLFVWHYFAE